MVAVRPVAATALNVASAPPPHLPPQCQRNLISMNR